MMRPLLASAILALLSSAVPARADDVDPEPSRTRSEAKSGDYVVKVFKNGEVTGSNKQGQLLWRYSTRVSADKAGQVVISGERVVIAHASVLAVLDLKTGKTFWYRSGSNAKAAMSIDGDRITLKSGGGKEVIDLATGKQLEVVRYKR
jgi:hypothetical protein